MPKKIKTKKIPLECPRCHEKWAEMSYDIETGEVCPKDIKVLQGTKIFKDGDAVACSLCSYQYNTWDMFITIGGANKKK
jgi:hypothetical protein